MAIDLVSIQGPELCVSAVSLIFGSKGCQVHVLLPLHSVFTCASLADGLYMYTNHIKWYLVACVVQQVYMCTCCVVCVDIIVLFV